MEAIFVDSFFFFVERRRNEEKEIKDKGLREEDLLESERMYGLLNLQLAL
jgi:hypothetical protein